MISAHIVLPGMVARIDIESPRFAAALAELFELDSPQSADIGYEVVDEGACVVVRTGAHVLFDGKDNDHALVALYGDLYERFIRVAGALLLHAGAAVKGGRAIVLPGAQESGKSTLTTLLAARGWSIVSDDIAAVDAGTTHVAPYPRRMLLRPPTLERNQRARSGIRILRILDAYGEIAHIAEPLNRARGTAPVALLAFPGWVHDGPTSIVRLTRGQAAAALMENAINLRFLGPQGVRLAAPIAVERLMADPSHALALADELGVLGFVSDHARRTPVAHPLWLAAWQTNLARNVRLSVALRGWWTVLDAAGHRPVAFKGPALARSAFGALGKRDSCDLDLIVSPSSFGEAVALLVQMGLKPIGGLELPAAHVGALTLEVPDAANTYTIDLHCGWVERWGGGPDCELPDEDLEPVQLAGATLRTLGARRALIHAAIHFEQHDYMLKMLLDVAVTARRVRSLGLITDTTDLASALGVRHTLDRALAAADGFVGQGQTAALPRAVRSAGALVAPRPPQLDFRRWRQLRPSLTGFGLLREAGRTVWPGDAHLRAAPEWVRPGRYALRRLLRPLRLALMLWRPTAINKPTPRWRGRAPLRFGRSEAAGREPTSDRR